MIRQLECSTHWVELSHVYFGTDSIPDGKKSEYWSTEALACVCNWWMVNACDSLSRYRYEVRWVHSIEKKIHQLVFFGHILLDVTFWFIVTHAVLPFLMYVKRMLGTCALNPAAPSVEFASRKQKFIVRRHITHTLVCLRTLFFALSSL